MTTLFNKTQEADRKISFEENRGLVIGVSQAAAHDDNFHNNLTQWLDNALQQKVQDEYSNVTTAAPAA